MFLFDHECLVDIFEEGVLLFKSHAKEIDLFSIGLDINKDAYSNLADAGMFKSFTVRKKGKKENKLIGYAGFMIYNNLHHKTSIHAKQDIVYIDKDFRGIGSEFIKYCDQQLEEIGIDYVIHSVPDCGKDWSPLLLDLGYKKLEANYIRKL